MNLTITQRIVDRPVRAAFLALLVVMALLAGCHSIKPLPPGIALAGADQPVSYVDFLADRTWVNEAGEREVDQAIFDEFARLIDDARTIIVADLFLFNDWQGPVPETTRALSGEITQRLIDKRQAHPEIQIVLITDPVNTLYNGLASAQFDALRAAGITVVQTDLNKLRDSNTLYSPFWRIFAKPFGNSPGGALPNPIGPGKVSLRTYLKLFNFKANHRKTLIADRGDELVAIVSSANPHDGSSAHRNAAIAFDGPAVLDLLATENAVLAFSDAPTIDESRWTNAVTEPKPATVAVITEKKIRDAIIDQLESSSEGDRVDLMMFYLSSRKVIGALQAAQKSGVRVRVMLDPNKDAFGREKNGVPNRPAARLLHAAGIPVRWCDTSGEQCHAKMMLVRRANGDAALISGSANFTRRNLNNYNLETDVIVKATAPSPVMVAALGYFDEAWFNLDGHQASVDYEVYRDDSLWHRFLYRFMEFTGISSF